ncbi:MAG: phosphohistidine phosphatase SixA [Verrucomicrobiae bacterium]|nr:phosphohistidine phosphatase SixA [Verrucomicrobiae bacterium]
MNIYFLRHGIAISRSTRGCTSDATRPLTNKGRSKLLAAARAMKKMKLKFDKILSSPYERAKQTAQLIAKELRTSGEIIYTPALAPTSDSWSVIRAVHNLSPHPTNVLLVGHEPLLSTTISILLAGKPNLQLKLKKGGLAKLSVRRLRSGSCARLNWLLTPAQMKRMK